MYIHGAVHKQKIFETGVTAQSLLNSTKKTFNYILFY